MQVNNLALNNAIRCEETHRGVPVLRVISQEQRHSFFPTLIRVFKVLAVSVILFSLFSSILFSKMELVELEHESTVIASKIKEVESENTRLAMELNSLLSADKINEYAVSVLGMCKVEPYQIRYFEDREADKVVIADGKSVNN